MLAGCRIGKESSKSTQSPRSKKTSDTLSPAKRSRAIRYRTGSARTEDSAVARYIRDHLRIRTQPWIDAGRRYGGGLGSVLWGVVDAITSGVLLATIAYTITATVGVDYELPAKSRCAWSMACVAPSGFRRFLCTIASTYWFAY
jgi:hypothetical protein